jgi:NhaP-type Na+/H+ or K+/H+ antiporter
MRIASMSQLSSSEINIALLSLGGLVLVLGLLSGFLKKRLFLSDPIVALLLGVLLGPSVLRLIDLAHWGKEALLHWLTKTLLWEVAFSVVLGAIIGYIAGRLLLWAEAKQTIEKPSFLAYTVALSLAVLGGIKLLGSDGILAVFAAGTIFSMVVGGNDRVEEEGVQEAVDRFFTLYIFVLLGLALPSGSFPSEPGSLKTFFQSSGIFAKMGCTHWKLYATWGNQGTSKF